MSGVLSDISEQRLREFAERARWYHTFDLGHGILTRGTYDLRPYVPAHHFPASLEGKTVLDVAASDGFYSFELERRGAASVLAVDTNLYDGSVAFDPSPAKMAAYDKKYDEYRTDYEEFKDIYSLVGLQGSNKLIVMRDFLGSKVQYKTHSVYELEKLNATFDLVFCGALLEHLKDPLTALEQLRAVSREVCIITVSSSLPTSRYDPATLRMRLALGVLHVLGVRREFSLNARERVIHYAGNWAGGSFFHLHPVTFREMALASGFEEAIAVDQFDVFSTRVKILNHYTVFHCFVRTPR